LLLLIHHFTVTPIERWQKNIVYRKKIYKTLEDNIITKGEYKRDLYLIFQDNPRSGSPCKFTESDKNKIVALASESPEQLGLPFTHWSLELLQTELINRGIILSISTSHLARLLKNKQVTTT
jgi:hypothetical protein